MIGRGSLLANRTKLEELIDATNEFKDNSDPYIKVNVDVGVVYDGLTNIEQGEHVL